MCSNDVYSNEVCSNDVCSNDVCSNDVYQLTSMKDNDDWTNKIWTKEQDRGWGNLCSEDVSLN